MMDNLTPASQSRNNESLIPGGQTAVADKSAGVQDDKTFTLKHNKQKVELGIHEILKYAEKGLDYDRIRPSHELLKSLAAKDGETDIERYIELKNRELAKDPEGEPTKISGQVAVQTKIKSDTADSDTQNAEDSGAAEELSLLRAQNEELKLRLGAESANKQNAVKAIGSVSGGDAVEKDYYSSQEWDRLPVKLKEKFIKNGRIFDFMKKWSDNA